MSQRDLVDELAGLAEIARKQGPIRLERVEVDDPFLAKGIRFVADGYDADFIRDNLQRDRDNSHIYMVAGRADTQPLFPDDPYIAANRRVTITLMREEPVIPANLKPKSTHSPAGGWPGWGILRRLTPVL